MANKFILLVEDNYYDELLARRAFSKNSLAAHLQVVRDGPEALDFLLGAPGQPPISMDLPALVLLDFQLPRLNGIEVLERLRAGERTRHLPVVLLTTADDEREVERARALGLISYERKPVDFHDFVGLIQRLGAAWLQSDEPSTQNAPLT